MKFYRFIAAFVFFLKKKDKKFKKLPVALKCLYFVTVLSSNSNVFLLVLLACKDLNKKILSVFIISQVPLKDKNNCASIIFCIKKVKIPLKKP